MRPNHGIIGAPPPPFGGSDEEVRQRDEVVLSRASHQIPWFSFFAVTEGGYPFWIVGCRWQGIFMITSS